ncbi:hypothetical protein JYT11_00650 [Planctomycetaceae bacterium AH-315-I19]|nr:hypothetical protein [Planctomycetaceae bacterium AH-315-I19]
MSRINTNVTSLIAQRVLGQNTNSLATSLERLSTGLRINRGADGPAALIASQNLRAEKAAIGSAISNAERADQVINIAEGGLDEISSLLTELQGLVTTTANTAGLSAEEKDANQLQIDSILQTIDRLASSTSFQGTKLLNGNYDYDTTSVSAAIDGFSVNGAKLGYQQTLDVDVLVTLSAQQAGYFLSFGGGIVDLGAATDRFVVELAGSKGSREFSFASGTSLADVVAAVNSFTSVTGLSADVSGTGIRVDSIGFGANEFVSVKVVNDGNIAAGDGIIDLAAANTNVVGATTVAFTDNIASNGLTDNGQDVEAIINGVTATTKGTTARINTDFLDISIDISATTGAANAQALGAINALQITGGGADFQLAGQVDINGKVSIGIGNVSSRTVGKSEITVAGTAGSFFLADLGSGSTLNLVDGDLAGAQDVVDTAIREVSGLRGRLGAFQQNTVGSTIRSLSVSLENTTAAESIIRDADFAAESANLSRNQILQQSATQILQLANAQPQNALALLG